LPILPYLLRQMASRIGNYSGTPFSLYMQQPQQSFNLGKGKASPQRIPGGPGLKRPAEKPVCG